MTLRTVLGLAFLVLPGAFGCNGAREIDTGFKSELVERIGKRLNRYAYAHGVDFAFWPEYVARHRSRLDSAKTAGELTSALNAALAEFDVSHLWVWSPAAMETREAGLQGGLGLKTVAVDGGRLVTLTIRDGPADAAGVRRGDVVTEVDGVAVSAASLRSGREGETRRLTLERPGEGTLEAAVTLREHPRANPATLQWLENDVAVITVSSFSRSFYEERLLYKEEVIEGLFDQAAAARGIIVDVRSNGGGYYLFPEHLAGMFMAPETKTYYVLHREEYEEFLEDGGATDASLLEMAIRSGQVIRPMAVAGRRIYAGPIAVLTDGRSGSAGETFPASVQAAGRGTLIGTKTVGSVLSGGNYRLPGGFELFYPQAESVLPDGTRIEGTGIRPDIELTPRQTADDHYIYRIASEAILSAPSSR